jgi:hypothetical protein
MASRPFAEANRVVADFPGSIEWRQDKGLSHLRALESARADKLVMEQRAVVT